MFTARHSITGCQFNPTMPVLVQHHENAPVGNNAVWCCFRSLIEVCHPDKLPKSQGHIANEMTKHLYNARKELS